VIIVVPARGGSKRVPHKNIYPLAGRPLLEFTLNAIEAAGLECPVYVSTDDEVIARVAEYQKGVTVIYRPAELASDVATTESVLLHALDEVAVKGVTPIWIMTLPPTSPFRKPETIRRFADAVLAAPDAQDCLMSTTENRGDFWLQQGDGTLLRLLPDAPRRQQERIPMYEENSAIYVTRVSALRSTGLILGRRVRGLPIAADEGFDINTKEDLVMAECLAAAMLVAQRRPG
jgi:CMP-N,N'-diacetyllegionaminic acid synthase